MQHLAPFIAIVMPAAKESRPVLMVVIVAVALACLFRYLPGLSAVPSGWALIICAVAAAAAGALLRPVAEEEGGVPA